MRGLCDTMRTFRDSSQRVSESIRKPIANLLHPSEIGALPTRSDTNRVVQPQKMARGFIIWIKKIEGLYNLYSESKGADQLRSYGAADLRLFSHMQKAGILITQLK